MSEHGSNGSNGSNGSIEEIGPEEIEESINENSEVRDIQTQIQIFLCY